MMFQSAGSITVMYATIFLDKLLKENMIDAHQVIHMHDELEIEAPEGTEEVIKELALKSFQYAGKYLKLNVEIVGEAKIGKTWADVH
jgi:DNA polymerase I-like protein with 3'-5' exonuclease and polymerase domains